MEKILLSFSGYLHDIKRIFFVIIFLLSSFLGMTQTITTNKTVTANVANCGIVDVKVDITGANPITRNSDVILVIDVSGSMGNTIPGDTKTSMDYAKLAAKSFIMQASANTNNRISIVSYTTNAKLELGLTYLDAAGIIALNAKINALRATSSTNVQDGIVKAEKELETNGRFDCSTARSIILLTDGVTTRTGTGGSTINCNFVNMASPCVTGAINAATNAKTTVKSAVTYNNQIFSVGLFGGISGNINTVGSDQYVAKYTLDGIQGSPSYITQSGANLTAIYGQIATQISWIAQSLIEKETIIPGFTIGPISVNKGTTSISGQVITWNTYFLNSETITLNYQLIPNGSVCGDQIVSTSTFNYKNTASCANDSKTITSPSYFVPCLPLLTGTLTACGSTILTATTNAALPTYVWYKDNIEITGETSSTLIATQSGAYKVKVKNGSTNCELTSDVSIVTITPQSDLVAPDDATINGCGTTSITGLIYNTTETPITLAELNSAGGSLANSAALGNYIISYSDTATGTCPTIVTRTFKVTTSCYTITKVQIITIQDSSAPTWTTPLNSLDRTLECSDAVGLDSAKALFPIASDLCDADVSDIVKTCGLFVVSASCSNAGTYTNTWTITDDCGNISDTFTQIITIQDTSKPIWITQIGSLNQTLECSDSAGLASAQALFPIASDLCDTDVSNIIKTSGQFTASGSCSNAGTYTNTWIVSDDCGNISDTFIQIITIQDATKPIWTTQIASLNQTLECSDSAGLASAQALFPIASDLCDTDVSNIVKTSGLFTASGSCSNEGTYTNTWIVSDDCGNISETFTQIITIQDTTKPVFGGNLPTDIAVSCDAVPEPFDMNATDNCDGNLPIVFSEIKSDILNGCDTNYTLTRKWSTSDCSGNTAFYIQIITVKDTTPPTGTAPADITGLQNTAAIPLPNAGEIKDAADNCSQNINITISDSNNGASGCEGNPYILTRTYTLTDCAGNKTELVQTFTVENKVSVSGIASHVTCFGENNGSITVTNSPGSTVVITNEKNEVVSNSNLPAGTYTLTASYSAIQNVFCSKTATVIITQPNYGTTNISSEACADDSSLIDLLALLPVNTPNTGNWIDTNNSNALQGNILNPYGLTLGNYLFEYKITDQNCPRSIVLNMEINKDCLVLACGNIVVHNAFSPNGDGLNDIFKIDSIDDITCYPENEVEIYNRWGILVFDTINYNNTTNAFDGTSRGRTTIKQSDGLPTGTYFYIVNYKSLDGNNVIQSNKKDGYLYLSK